MQVSDFLLNITSEDPDRLYAFYRDVVGLPIKEGMGERALQMGSATLAFDGHAETNGPAREPSRFLFDLFIESDVKAERERMEALGATFIRKEGVEYWGGVISTLVDPDGNYCQVIQFVPALAKPEGVAEPATA